MLQNSRRPVKQCLHHLFELQARRTPERAAVLGGGEMLTYQVLNQRANQLAHYLQKQGVSSETPIGVCVKRSVDMIIGLLGILKAGGVYVPLDPDYPYERLAMILQDTRIRLLVLQKQVLQELFPDQDEVYLLDIHDPALLLEPTDNPDSQAQREMLAYILYTSGSTGKPNGVCCHHQGVINLLEDCQRRAPLLAGRRYSIWTSTNFDVSLYEIFSALVNGGTLCIPPDEIRAESTGFFAWLQRQCIHSAYIPPFMLADLSSWLQQDGNQLFLQRLLVGVEPIPERLLVSLTLQVQGLRIINGYGPTEATICASLYSVPSQVASARIAPIGRPVQNMQIYLLDASLRPVHIGVPGELYIGGVGVTRGYWRHPMLTAERFIPDPFAREPGARLYRTGDLARYLPDGDIQFVGRKDHQVKMRGFRIELGEIEAIARQHPAVQETVVLAREDVPGEKRLVAYIVCSRMGVVTASDLRHFLQKQVPAYMVPEAFVFLEKLPVTLNGKIDHRTLPPPDAIRPELKETFVAARTPTETALIALWSDLLKIKMIGVHDNFFDLGGNSLTATRIMSRVREAFSVELPVYRLFEAPTIASLAACIEMAQQRKEALQIQPARRIVSAEKPALSFAQQRLWFFDQLAPGNPVYHMALGVHLIGQLNTVILEQSFNEIIRRHDAMRTTFIAVDGQPVQVVASAWSLDLPTVDLRGFPKTEQEARIQQLARQEAQRSFDLTRGPLLRTLLLYVDEREHVLLLTIHHIISDDWSMGILLKEITTLYAAFEAGRQSPLPSLPLQYTDHALWQRAALQGDVLEEQLRYWRAQLAGAPTLLQLPADRPRPAVQTFRGATQSFVLARPLVDALKNLSRREDVTLFMTLCAAFVLFLQRYTGQDDIVVGSPIANRTRLEVEGLIGFFVNTLALRINLSGNPSFRELLRQVRTVALAAYAHQELPFEKLVEELHPERDLSYNPLVQVVIALQNAQIETHDLPDLTVRWQEIETGTAPFDMMLAFSEVEQGLQGVFTYTTDLFEAATIARMADHLQILLHSIAATPENRLSLLQILPEAERHQLLVEWNKTRSIYPEAQAIHRLFEAQATRTPEAIALVCEDECLGYHALNSRANQLAHYLYGLGVRPETLVGICVEPSVEMVVGLLGILKAGGTYVPLDPAYPNERLAFILEDTHVSVLLTQQRLLAQLPTCEGLVICLDSDWKSIAQENEGNLDLTLSGACPAYVIYTSGSTGSPKGVLVSHTNVVRLFAATRDWYHFDRHDVWTLFHSYAFDFSVWELWGALLHGGRLIVVSYWTSRTPEAFYELLRSENVTVVNQTPSAFYQLIQVEETKGGANDLTLRLVIFGGEALDFHKLKPWFEHHGDLSPQLVNMYGITETTVHVTYYPLSAADTNHAPASLIGRPVPDLQVYLLDRQHQLVPIGVPGEMYIGGAGVALGYLHCPELTAARFSMHTFDEKTAVRLYKTGDMARYRLDGTLEFLGRIDQQVKIRGYRIEPGEIESALHQHPFVSQAVVLAREDMPGEKRLVAYIVGKPLTDDQQFVTTTENDQYEIPPLLSSRQRTSVTELRHFLQRKLPDYMLPSAFVMLDALPLTTNGKLDQRALPVPERVKLEREETFVPARTAIEEAVAGIWASVLGLERVGVFSNFFELGGHSLLAVQIVSRIREAFRVNVSVRTLFEAPTVADLARHVEATGEDNHKLSVLPMRPVPQITAFPLSIAQEWRFLVDRTMPHVPLRLVSSAFRLTGPLSIASLERSFHEIVRRHEALRTTFASQNGRDIPVIASAVTLPVTIIDLTTLSNPTREAKAILLATEAIHRLFDRATGPLLRVTIFRLNTEDHVLLFVVDHIIFDGWSLRLLLQELSALYDTFCRGHASTLPELPMQYKDWAYWQRQWTKGEEFESHLLYWKQKLAVHRAFSLSDMYTFLEFTLPRALPRPEVESYHGAMLSLTLSPELAEALEALHNQAEVTPFTLFLAALKSLLYCYSGNEHIKVFTSTANRTRIETESIIGAFNHKLVLCTNFSANPTFLEILERVHKTMVEANIHQDLPWPTLVQALQPEYYLHPRLVPLVYFDILRWTNNLELTGVSVAPLSVGTKVADPGFSILVEEQKKQLRIYLTYNTGTYDARAMTQFLNDYHRFLKSIAAHPQRRISDFTRSVLQ